VPLDHYVSLVHLRKFYSPALGKRMYAIRKTDLKAFTPDSQAVCRIMDGTTNAYLSNDRAVEDFLKTGEPNYSAAVVQLVTGEIDGQCVHAIAGFIAYVMACSPAGMRIQAGPLRSIVEADVALMEARGALPPPRPVLRGLGLTELLHSGAVKTTIDPEFPQAIGIQSLLRIMALFGNFKWEIRRNCADDSPFFTSDFPVAIEPTDAPWILNRIVPLAPTLALRIRPDPTVDRNALDLTFSGFGYRRRDLGRDEVTRLNRLIVRCAEETVFYRDDHAWVRPFVAKNRHYRIEPDTHRVATPSGTLLVLTQRIAANAPANER